MENWTENMLKELIGEDLRDIAEDGELCNCQECLCCMARKELIIRG